MSKNIIVYGKDFKTASNKLDAIFETVIDKSTIVAKHKCKYDYAILLRNGDRYTALQVSDSTRGYKWQYAYIDRNIDRDVLNDIIFSSFQPLDNDFTDFNTKMNSYYELY
jgi:hypothetical protein